MCGCARPQLARCVEGNGRACCRGSTPPPKPACLHATPNQPGPLAPSTRARTHAPRGVVAGRQRVLPNHGRIQVVQHRVHQLGLRRRVWCRCRQAGFTREELQLGAGLDEWLPIGRGQGANCGRQPQATPACPHQRGLQVGRARLGQVTHEGKPALADVCSMRGVRDKRVGRVWQEGWVEGCGCTSGHAAWASAASATTAYAWPGGAFPAWAVQYSSTTGQPPTHPHPHPHLHPPARPSAHPSPT